jgi:hypothetical protein
VLYIALEQQQVCSAARTARPQRQAAAALSPSRAIRALGPPLSLVLGGDVVRMHIALALRLRVRPMSMSHRPCAARVCFRTRCSAVAPCPI